MSTAQPILKKRKPNQSYPPGLGFCGSQPHKDSSVQLFDGGENQTFSFSNLEPRNSNKKTKNKNQKKLIKVAVAAKKADRGDRMLDFVKN